MKYVLCIATFVAILFYYLNVTTAVGATHDNQCINSEYIKMYLQEKANLTRHTWTRTDGRGFGPVATSGFLEVQNN
jgi:hypothetical protein